MLQENLYKIIIFLLIIIVGYLLLKTPYSQAPKSINKLNTTIIESNYAELNQEDQALVDAAEAAMANTYNPYSHFAVGAALRTANGDIITGTNYENAAYGSTICAERAAILRANSMGEQDFVALAVIGSGLRPSLEPITPCGACRQVIYETADRKTGNLRLILSNTKKNKVYITDIKDLLPLAFGPSALGLRK